MGPYDYDLVIIGGSANGSQAAYTAGRIPTTGPVRTTYADNFMMVGDVAGQTKPTTGGGVILGGNESSSSNPV